MNGTQKYGVYLAGLMLGWAIGYALFGADQTWLFGIKSFIWCGFAGGIVATLITNSNS